MTHQRKTWKRFMETILSQLPNYVTNYPPSDQIVLNEFLSVLQSYEVDTQAARKQLLESFQRFNNKYRNSEKFWSLPFLWFVESYFQNAYNLLSVASFHADDFYEYFVKQLRGDSDTHGVFQLVSKGTPLTDFAWEQLQYACNRLSVPLTSEELHVLEIVHTLCMEIGIKALNQSYIKNYFLNRAKSPTLSRKLVGLFSRLDSNWLLYFYTPAFDLELLFFHFQLSESTFLEDIIDFHDPTNTTLCYSNIYWIRGFHNTYCGILFVPTKFVESLRKYLQQCERLGQLILYELTKIDTSHLSVSLFLYQATKGWRNPTQTDWRRLVPILKTQNPRKKRIKHFSFYLSPPFNKFWHHNQSHNPSQIIALYCKIPRRFSFQELPLGSHNSQITMRLSKPEIKLLRELYLQKTLHVCFLSLRLISEFSLDNYWITLPKMPLDQLSRLLAWLPSSYLYLTETNIHIWTFLTSKLAQWLRTDLEWSVMPIVENHNPKNLVFDWYDLKTQQWKAPLVLTT